MENQQREELKRELGIFDVAVNVVNISIASGIFLLPAIIAGILGSASIIAYLLCGCMFLLVALCYAEVGSLISESGGAYIYLEKAFGPYIGFLANAISWFGLGVLVSAALINGIADMLSVPVPIFGIKIYRGLFFLLLFSGYAYINIIGVKQGMITVKIFTLIKVVPLISLVLLGLFASKTQNLSWQAFPGFEKLGEASLLLFFAFTGGETALNMGGEMKNPNRTAPLGLLIGVIIIVLFFCLIQIVAQGVLGSDIENHTKAPLAAVANSLAGPWGFTVLIGCAIASIMGSLYSLVLVFPRIMYAGSKDRQLPGFLAGIHSRYATPYWAIIIFTIISFIMAISGGFKQLLILATASTLLLHAGVVLAAIKFRLKPIAGSKAGFRVPGGLTIPIITIIMLCWFLFQSKANEVKAMIIFILTLSVIYALKKMKAV